MTLVGCGSSTEGLDATADREPSQQVAETSEQVDIEVQLRTEDGLIGRNEDDELCFWVELGYVLRDGEGSIIATGSPPVGGSFGDHDISLGKVVSTRPNYECVLDFAIRAPIAEFYELEITGLEADPLGAGEPYSVETTFDQLDATAGIRIRVN